MRLARRYKEILWLKLWNVNTRRYLDCEKGLLVVQILLFLHCFTYNYPYFSSCCFIMCLLLDKLNINSSPFLNCVVRRRHNMPHLLIALIFLKKVDTQYYFLPRAPYTWEIQRGGLCPLAFLNKLFKSSIKWVTICLCDLWPKIHIWPFYIIYFLD